MDLTVLQQLLDAMSAGHYLGFIMIATLYLRKLASPSSGFPLDIPTQWLPSVSAFGGIAYGFEASVQGGASCGAAALGALAVGASTGFFDGLLTAIFNHGAAPKWAQTLVFLVDDVAGKGGGSTSGGSASAVVTPEAAKPVLPVAPVSKRTSRGMSFGFSCVALLAVLAACSPAQMAEADKVEQTVLADIVSGKSLPQIESDVATLVAGQPGADVVVLVDDALTLLVDLNVIPASVLPYAKSLLAQEHPKAMAHRASVLDGGAQ